MNLLNRLFLYTATAILMTACAGVPSDIEDTTAPVDAETPAAEEPSLPQENPQQYVDLANQAVGLERDQYLIRAAELFIEQGDFDSAQVQLQGIDIEITESEILANIQLLSAEIALGKGEPRRALKLLPFGENLPALGKVRIYGLRARAFLDAGYPLESAKTRIQMDKLISDEFEQEINHQAIWEALSLLPETTLNQLSLAPPVPGVPWLD